MNDTIEYIRSDYSSLFDFLGQAHGSLYTPIYAGFLVLLTSLVLVARARPALPVKLLGLYFAWSFFTNYAYQIAGARFFDMVGLLIVLVLVLAHFRRPARLPVPYAAGIFLFAAIVLHAMLAFVGLTFSPYPADSGLLAWQIAQGIRLLVAVLIGVAFHNFVKSSADVVFIFRCFFLGGLAALAIYYLQAVLFLAGVPTVGTFAGSGEVMIPRFGSVTIEGGHFGRVIAPLIIIALAVRYSNQTRTGWLFFLIMLLLIPNISLSQYAFILCFFLMAVLFHLLVQPIRGMSLALLGIALGGVAGAIAFPNILLALSEKIIGLLQGNYAGDQIEIRSATFLKDAWQGFPFGIGFGVSRAELPTGQDTDMGLYALLSQLSLLGVAIATAYIASIGVMVWNCIQNKEARRWPMWQVACISSLATPLIFSIDVTWLYPNFLLAVYYLIFLSHRPQPARSPVPTEHSSGRQRITRPVGILPMPLREVGE